MHSEVGETAALLVPCEDVASLTRVHAHLILVPHVSNMQHAVWQDAHTLACKVKVKVKEKMKAKSKSIKVKFKAKARSKSRRSKPR
jgi:hypothetical protein